MMTASDDPRASEFLLVLFYKIDYSFNCLNFISSLCFATPHTRPNVEIKRFLAARAES
jgi:hypothetical protein